MTPSPVQSATPTLSIIVPALNEQDNVQPLADEVHAAMRDGDIAYELIIVDDGSTDDTLARIKAVASGRPQVIALHRPQPRGQSAATHAGIAEARGEWIAMLDADLQNDPADLPRLLSHAIENNLDLVQGVRANREDTGIRKFSSKVGLKTRQWIIGDTIIDTGCAARVIRASFAKQIPLYFHGMHRFIAQYAIILGAAFDQLPVNHRPRTRGDSKYGISNRAIVGFFDCLAIRWMKKRHRDAAAETATPSTDDDQAQVAPPDSTSQAADDNSQAPNPLATTTR